MIFAAMNAHVIPAFLWHTLSSKGMPSVPTNHCEGEPIHMKTTSARLLPLAALLIVTVFSRPCYADSPALEHVKINLASVQQVLVDPNLAGAKHRDQRRKLMRRVLQKLFDFKEMSRRALGSNARRYKDRLDEFTPLFVDFLEYAYMGILEENGDAKIRYVDVVSDGGYAQVQTRTKLKDGSAYRVDYRLRMNPAGWRVYDVAVENISLVNNYRSQFNRILKRASFDDLLGQLRDRKQNFN